MTLLVYLTPSAPVDAGTSLWLHRSSGLAAKPSPTDAKRLRVEREELERRLYRDSSNPRRWQEVDRIGNVYNRAIAFRSGLLHSATRHFGSSLTNGRLFQTFRFAIDQ